MSEIKYLVLDEIRISSFAARSCSYENYSYPDPDTSTNRSEYQANNGITTAVTRTLQIGLLHLITTVA